jgi:hypothetical protein
LGITLIRNQTVEDIPKAIKAILGRADFPIRFLSLRKNKLILVFIIAFFDKDNSVFGFSEWSQNKKQPAMRTALKT